MKMLSASQIEAVKRYWAAKRALDVAEDTIREAQKELSDAICELDRAATTMKNFWLSWYGNAGPWALEWPWWISGYRMDGDEEIDKPDTPTVCAAVQAESEEEAKEIVLAAHDMRPDDLEWRFCNERPAGWSPFVDRFPRADWMKWPEKQP